MIMEIIGHRGARGLKTENTLKSFQLAISLGVDAIECDVRITKDNIPIMNHDKNIINSLGKKYYIRQFKYNFLKQQKPDLITLQEAIVYINQRLPLHIEIKPQQPTNSIVDLLNKFLDSGWQLNNLIISSFDLKVLLTVHNSIPPLQLVILQKYNFIQAIKKANKLGSKNICLNQKYLNRNIVKFITNRGFHVSSYTINNTKKAERLKHAGLTAIITDFPDRFITHN